MAKKLQSSGSNNSSKRGKSNKSTSTSSRALKEKKYESEEKAVKRRYSRGYSDSDRSKYYASSSSSMYLTNTKTSTSTDRAIAASSSASAAPWTPPPGVDVDPFLSSLKRSSEVLYHPTVLSVHNTIGQTEAWYSTNYLAKRSRFESGSNLVLYPQRPGEKDCAHYMLTRTCKFGDSCKFDHPFWVPEGGIPNWKEVPLADITEPLPERPGEPDCPFYIKTQRCKYGSKCKFNHPKDKLALTSSEQDDPLALPERPSEATCAFYARTGKCKFGATCKFNHPKDVQIVLGQENGTTMKNESGVTDGTIGDAEFSAFISYNPALFHNSKGLPIRPGEVDCPFYLKTGSCKFGATCRYNHPDRTAINPAAALGHPIVAASANNLNIGVVNPAASIYQAMTQPLLGVGASLYPQRPGHAECDFYMKTGECKFGERCRFHHPIDRTAPTAKLTLAGLPRREGSVHCPYYMKTGTCKFGATCKFDHPPPGEVMAVSSSQGDMEGAEGGL